MCNEFAGSINTAPKKKNVATVRRSCWNTVSGLAGPSFEPEISSPPVLDTNGLPLQDLILFATFKKLLMPHSLKRVFNKFFIQISRPVFKSRHSQCTPLAVRIQYFEVKLRLISRSCKFCERKTPKFLLPWSDNIQVTSPNYFK